MLTAVCSVVLFCFSSQSESHDTNNFTLHSSSVFAFRYFLPRAPHRRLLYISHFPPDQYRNGSFQSFHFRRQTCHFAIPLASQGNFEYVWRLLPIWVFLQWVRVLVASFFGEWGRVPIITRNLFGRGDKHAHIDTFQMPAGACASTLSAHCTFR